MAEDVLGALSQSGVEQNVILSLQSNTNGSSWGAVVTALVAAVGSAIFYIVWFILLRQWFKNIYMPRTYFRTIPEKDRTPMTRPGSKKWYQDVLWLDDKFLLRHHSLDAYLFLRFFRVLILISGLGALLTWPTLFPVNATGGGGQTDLNKISFSNTANNKRLWAHAVICFAFVGFVLLVITRERIFLIGLKQAYLTTKKNASRLSSRVVLFLAAPPTVLKEANLTRYFGQEAKRTWVIHDTSRLEKLIDDRNSQVYALEEVEVALARSITDRARMGQRGLFAEDTADAVEVGDGGAPNPAFRPKSRTIPLVGKSVDSIDWRLEKLSSAIEEAETSRKTWNRSLPNSNMAVFVEFSDQLAAYQALQSVRHHSPLALQPRFINVQPKEVLWANITKSSSLRLFQTSLSAVIMVATIVFWAVPVGFVATWTQLTQLINQFPWLDFLKRLPPVVFNGIEGILPPFFVSLLVSYVPKWFRYISRRTSSATTSEAEARVQKWYFTFQFIQVFLVTSFASSAVAIAQKIADNPSKVPDILAQNLPQVTNFYLSYITIQGIGAAASNLSNVSDVFQFVGFGWLFDKTPRQKYERQTYMRGTPWATWYPKYANMGVIVLAYSCIAPLILGFALVGFAIFYLTFRYLLFYTRAATINTHGDAYGRALQHLMVGIYVLELALFGLLSARKAVGPMVIMMILLLSTLFYHISTNQFLSPLERYMPIDVLSDANENSPLVETEEEGTHDTGSAGDGNTAESNREDHSDPRKMSLFNALAGGRRLPSILLDPLATLLEPYFATHDSLRPWLHDGRTEEEVSDDSVTSPGYTQSELDNIYLPPSVTSKTPIIWLAHDEHGVSKWAIEKNQAAAPDAATTTSTNRNERDAHRDNEGENTHSSSNDTGKIVTSDAGAEVDPHTGKIIWDKDDFSKAPIFKPPKVY